jgi:hypothetical protein
MGDHRSDVRSDVRKSVSLIRRVTEAALGRGVL